MIKEAANVTSELLDTLEETAKTATAVTQSAFAGRLGGSGGWWPFLVCPAVTIIAGSYGLEPSVVRNLGLLALGELVALYLSAGPIPGVHFWADTFRSATNATAL